MPAAEASGFSLPDLPVSIAIGDISAKRIVLGAAVLGQGVEGTLKASLQLAGGQGQAKLVLARTDGPKGVFDLAASYANATGQLVLALSAAEDAGGVSVRLLGVPGLPSAELTIAGDGPVTGFAADVSLKTDGAVRLAGKVALTGDTGGTGFTADLAGDPTPVFLPQYAAFFGPDLRLHAVGKRGADGRLDLSQFSLMAQAIAVDGSLSLDATGAPEAFALTGRLGLPEGPVVLPLVSARETKVSKADLSLSYDRSKGDGWQVQATVWGLDHQAFTAATMVLSGAGRIAQGSGGAEFDGKLTFQATGLLPANAGLAQALGSAIQGSAALAWKSGDGQLTLSNLALDGTGFQIATSGTIGSLADGFTLKGAAKGSYPILRGWIC